MKKERRDDSFIKNPFYPGGNQAMSKFITDNLKYPKHVLEGKISGEVYLKYSIDLQGNVFDVRIVGGLDEACNAEAVRVVKLLKFIVPKNPKKLKITFHKNITIHFKLKHADQTKQPDPINASDQTQEFQYTVIASQKTTDTESPKPVGTTYSYTITITPSSTNS